ncbi:GGDEF domain-containing protein [Edaphobacillus lindanitolerans]|uniref:Diguanylate cyclase (GGDEF) domain-containing protein n=1 Tax=Edaphobacillus lindanitolerans TaxID=550447 RepID=A0A1U7PQB9_9BACI|nr:sensor domain-containing diguanylate cyclase [Edaphobacillus lindanitolerans]SIT83304.1 diguanylate cyclase (GGDEF) domain-containing protein [Edaphobacillus lindanitolerans]
MEERKRRIKSVIFIIWLLTVPPGFVWLAVNGTYDLPSLTEFVSVTLLSMAAVSFPVIRNGIPLLLVGWLTIPMFFGHGLFVEAAIMQLALLAAIPLNRNAPDPVHRFFFNSLMFFLLSLLSAGAFRLAGGEVGAAGLYTLLLPAAAYMAVHAAGNTVLLHAYQLISGVRLPIWSQINQQDALTALAVFPLALANYYLFHAVGHWSLPLLAVPFFTVTLLIRMYDASERVNTILLETVSLGHKLSGKLTQPEVLDLFAERVATLLPVDYLYIFDIRNGRIEPLKMMEEGEFVDIRLEKSAPEEGIGGMIYGSEKGRMFGSQSEWSIYANDYYPPEAESLIGVHIVRNKKVEGILGVMSKRKNAYEEYQLRILELLGSYLAVALDKARHVQQTVKESERCGLTGLYNYRYMERALRQNVERVNSGELVQLSVIMLDIDHFKQINDAYGHQAGNEVLVGFARLFEAMAEPEWILARYGGEEFVAILPETSKDRAVRRAEEIRRVTGDHPFLVHPDGQEGVEVGVTVSIGISSAPDDGEDAMSVIRNADRALYTGAKREGRNKVAAYSG